MSTGRKQKFRALISWVMQVAPRKPYKQPSFQIANKLVVEFWDEIRLAGAGCDGVKGGQLQPAINWTGEKIK